MRNFQDFILKNLQIKQVEQTWKIVLNNNICNGPCKTPSKKGGFEKKGY